MKMTKSYVLSLKRQKDLFWNKTTRAKKINLQKALRKELDK